MIINDQLMKTREGNREVAERVMNLIRKYRPLKLQLRRSAATTTL